MVWGEIGCSLSMSSSDSIRSLSFGYKEAVFYYSMSKACVIFLRSLVHNFVLYQCLPLVISNAQLEILYALLVSDTRKQYSTILCLRFHVSLRLSRCYQTHALLDHKLVENKEVFSTYVDHKFQQLDRDEDGQLSVKELQPAVADIGAALGLPAQGTSPDSNHIYSEVLNEFTHGKQEKVSKTEFKEVLPDILLGMAAGLKQDPIVILRIYGEDLQEFINSPCFEPEMVSIFSQIESPDGSLHDYIINALDKLTVDQGMPPSSDSWVMSNIVEPALQSCGIDEQGKPVSEETFLVEFKKLAQGLAQHLKDQPVIVAHSENTFDVSRIKRLLSNKFELDKKWRYAGEYSGEKIHGFGARVRCAVFTYCTRFSA